jgi:hypothetical protein
MYQDRPNDWLSAGIVLVFISPISSFSEVSIKTMTKVDPMPRPFVQMTLDDETEKKLGYGDRVEVYQNLLVSTSSSRQHELNKCYRDYLEKYHPNHSSESYKKLEKRPETKFRLKIRGSDGSVKDMKLLSSSFYQSDYLFNCFINLIKKEWHFSKLKSLNTNEIDISIIYYVP